MTNANEMVSRLNEMLAIDPEATAKLVGHRVQCCDALAADDSPFVCGIDADGRPRIGTIGLLNSFIALGSSRVAAVYDDSGKLTSFTVVST